MLLPRFEYVQPATLQEACAQLTAHGDEAALLAGGTDLMVAMRRRIQRPAYVIGLKKLTEMAYIRQGDGELRIGALTTLDEIERSTLIADKCPAVAQAVELVAVPPIRRAATIGGNLALDTRCIYYNQSEFWRKAQGDCFKTGGSICYAVKGARRCFAVYQGDLAPVLMSLDAKLKITSASSERVISIAEFFTGRGERPNVLRNDELLSEVIVPVHREPVVCVYEKLRVRNGMDFPLAGIAIALHGNGKITGASVILSAIGAAPVQVDEAGDLLRQNDVDEELIEMVSEIVRQKAHPVANLCMDTEYRRAMTKVLTKRALCRALSVMRAS